MVANSSDGMAKRVIGDDEIDREADRRIGNYWVDMKVDR